MLFWGENLSKTFSAEMEFCKIGPWSEQSRIEDVDAVGGHDHLDVLGSLEAVQLKSILFISFGRNILGYFLI
jgi:hypothetical protein